MSDYIIRAKGIKKYFGGVKALDGVDLEIKKGEVHCLAGQNGCGKSTIINIISGFYTPDAGEVEIDGVSYSKLTPKQSIAAGVQVIYQDLSVFPNLTVMENLALNMELADGRKFVSKKRFRKIAEEAVAKINFEIDLDEIVGNLSVADKQLIAISRALLNNAKLIIMDEPTTAITKKEVKALFDVIRELQKQNIAILFVSHKLDEVFEIAENFTIFRNGKNVAAGLAKDLTQDKFTYYMTGREFKDVPFEFKADENTPNVLEVKNLNLKNGFKDINFSLRKGEILGITGLLGSGRTELVQALFGYNKADSGDIIINGEKVTINNVKDGIKHGIGYVPPERIVEGVFLPQSIKENISIEKWDDYAGPLGVMNQKKIDEVVNEWVEKLHIKIGNVDDAMNTLSGGNQQKCVLAKWLILDLNVLILNGPTVGVDIGAKYDIYELIKDLAANGLSVIIISDDIPEILSNCNRVLVMRRGEIVKEGLTIDMDEASLAEFAVAD